MIVYKDVISNDEMLSDSFPTTEVADVLYRVECKNLRKGAVKVDIGANPSAGDGEACEDDEGGAAVEDEGYDVIDVVDCFRLQNMPFDKKGYMAHIKDYMKAIKKRLEEKKPERVAIFEKGATEQVKAILGNFAKYDFYVGEEMDAEAMVVLYEQTDDGKQYMYFWKDGLHAQKY